ncbi:quinoprotein dehydrogenase-associated SoxYZ-like carrier [Hyphomicrobium sp.]|uniref:quinoprotein dehydrogenase-associated SoxYZ-like carrier n=1 Tax=Hyphomicrobium sp. TaxID=82 RepID=UPI002D76A5F5|nr:quinoprotein dehydrogenase-associated SoxYZ-like carrier [Hyphomicrobium sp.]HET6390825.1 quinoprotein dehydrogenase-associated SoxYZ-like carrier [Hyphomicrobium sp.]
MRSSFIRSGFAAGIAAVLGLMAVYSGARADDTDAMWDSLRRDVFGTRVVADGAGKVTLEAPYRAEDAATVPLTVRLPAEFAKDVKSLTLVIDKNPSPVVATFNYGEAAGSGERVLATRVRIDQYSNVRAIAETNDGRLFMTTKFVKASGGCSAPAGKDPEEAAKTLGKMKVTTAFKDPENAALQEAQVMIRHPNNSGLQQDQLTGLYIPPHFVEKVAVTTGGKTIFTMTGGISISENPNFRFTYQGNPADVMSVMAEDTKGNEFKGSSTPGQS